MPSHAARPYQRGLKASGSQLRDPASFGKLVLVLAGCKVGSNSPPLAGLPAHLTLGLSLRPRLTREDELVVVLARTLRISSEDDERSPRAPLLVLLLESVVALDIDSPATNRNARTVSYCRLRPAGTRLFAGMLSSGQQCYASK